MSESRHLPGFLQLEPIYREYVWGGHKLRPGGELTAEAWVVYGQNKITNGDLSGKTLDEITTHYGDILLGTKAIENGTQFPLLIKLLDVAQWLSIQVHPNDVQAKRLAGPGNIGKTEAWYAIEADPNAQIIAGVKKAVTQETFQQVIQNGTVEEAVQYLPMRAGDSILVRPGTLHALGPGLLIYEVQQTSDITYRVYDWGRPESEGRKLHIEQAQIVASQDALAEIMPTPELEEGKELNLCTSDYFNLSVLQAAYGAVAMDTHGESFHALTVIEGQVRLVNDSDNIELSRLETALVPASTREYRIEPLSSSRVLKSTV